MNTGMKLGKTFHASGAEILTWFRERGHGDCVSIAEEYRLRFDGAGRYSLFYQKQTEDVSKPSSRTDAHFYNGKVSDLINLITDGELTL